MSYLPLIAAAPASKGPRLCFLEWQLLAQALLPAHVHVLIMFNESLNFLIHFNNQCTYLSSLSSSTCWGQCKSLLAE